MPRLTPQSDVKCCGTCRHADWWLTDKGNFRKDSTTRCRFPEDKIVLPIIPIAFECTIRFSSYVGPTDGADCPCYARKEADHA